MKGRVGAVAIILLLLAGTAAASHNEITINNPLNATYHQDGSVTVDLDTGENYALHNYSIPTAGITNTDVEGKSSEVTSKLLDDGYHHLQVFANSGEEFIRHDRYFAVDTTGPYISSRTPANTTFDRYPTLNITYNDSLSEVAPETVRVWIDGEQRSAEKKTANYFELPLNSISEGGHKVTLSFNDTNNNQRLVPTWDFTIPVKPRVENTGVSGVMAENEPELSVDVRDPSGINATGSYFHIEGDDDTDFDRKLWFSEIDNSGKAIRGKNGNELTFSTTLNNLDDGEYSVTAHVVDGEGGDDHEVDKEWSFTVDTTAPDLELLSHDDGDVVSGEQQFEAEATDALSAVDRVRFELGDESEYSRNGVDDVFADRIDTDDDVANGGQTLTVSAYDAAGNKKTVSVDLTVDNTAPDVRSISVYPNTADTVTQLSATLVERVSGIRDVTYKIQDTGISGDLSAKDGAFDETIEPVTGHMNLSTLEEGEYTAYIEVEDGAGHTSQDWQTFTVDYDVANELELSLPDPMLVAVGESSTFDLSVSNIGDIGDVVSVGTDTEFAADISPEQQRIDAGETETFQLTLENPSDALIGPQTLAVTAQGLTTEQSASGTVYVQPPAARQQEIEQRFQNLETTFDSMNQSRSEYNIQLPEARQTFEETATVLQEIDSLIDNGRYYTAAERMDTANVRLNETETALTGMVSKHNRQQLIATVLKAFAVLMLVGIAFGVYRMMPAQEGEGFDTGNGFVPRQESVESVQEQVNHVVEHVRDRGQELVERAIEQASDNREDRESTDPHTVEGWKGFGSE